ncbi:MAG: RNB domain-containing ribonuclease [Terriglobales bacterium]
MNDVRPKVDLQVVARQVMLANGFDPDFPPAVEQQLTALKSPLPKIVPGRDARDLRGMLWSSIDNDTSKDLDQIEVAEQLPTGDVKVLVGIADVDAYVPKSSPIDEHAASQATTVYTGVRNFSMLPEMLSTGITSLLENQDNAAIIIEFVVSSDGHVRSTDLYPALVRNKAQLTYNAVGAWFEAQAPAPPKVAASGDLQVQLKLQNTVAQALKQQRYLHGALDIETVEVRPVLLNNEVTDVVKQEKNPATELIEDFMIAANEVVARTLKEVSSIRRVVKTPERWDRIVQLASAQGGKLPAQPDSKALNNFLMQRKAADPARFADLSLAVIKLMGPGAYILERPGDPDVGHFGLAVQDYTHSTAPNRRFADLVTQRLIKAFLANGANPYSDDQLDGVAKNCTLKEDAARKVEREMTKRMSAVAMSGRVGEIFDALVTGASSKGTFVRVLKPHVEGMLVQGEQGLDVGDILRARLLRTDVQHGYIDFARA